MSESRPSHLSQMGATHWSDVLAPNHSSLAPDERRARLERFFDQYSSAVRKYLGHLLATHRNRNELVEESFQLFAARFLEGRLGSASPEGGRRFRHYLKATLRNLVYDRYRERPIGELDSALSLAASAASVSDEDRAMEAILREEFVQRAMRQIADLDRRVQTCLHEVLRLRIRFPDAEYTELAEHLSGSLGKTVDAGWVRKRMHFAREKLKEFLREEVGASLDDPSEDAVDDELAALGLLEYVRKKG
ncbi:MAG: RNA polymerase sigma factor [Planctomycetaceae bacterium]